MKKLSILTYTVGLSMMALTLAACTKNDEPATSQEAEIVIAEPVVQEIEAVCDDASTKLLVDALQADLMDKALFAASSYNDVYPDFERQVHQKLSRINIRPQNVGSSGASCHADVHFALPSKDIGYANNGFKELGMGAVDEQAAELGAALVGGSRLIVKDFNYTIENNQAVFNPDSQVLDLIADTLVMALHKENESRIRTKNATIVRTQPAKPIEETQLDAPDQKLENQDVNTSAQVKNQEKPKDKPRPAEPKPTKTQLRQDQPSIQPEQPQKTANQAKKPPQEPVRTKSSNDKSVQLTIVESNDTY